jgi:DNA-binding response OmpR family regulator
MILARPELGRPVADELNAAGYEVYRTPSAMGIAQLHDQIRPHLAIIATELLGQNAIDAALELRTASGDLPVLLLGDASGDCRAAGFPMLSSAETFRLQTTVAYMLELADSKER